MTHFGPSATASKTPSVFSIQARVRKGCHLPIGGSSTKPMGLESMQTLTSDRGRSRKVQLNELNELRDHAYENSLIYKEKTKRIHDSKIKNRIFNVGDRVLLFNSRLKIFSGKLKTVGVGPFTVTQVFPSGNLSSYPKLRAKSQSEWSTGSLKHYFGGTYQSGSLGTPDTFPMDQ
ncbi:hypothetical protein Tco_0104024 [Tanacetum coccineum]